jgi:hypothetical protein
LGSEKYRGRVSQNGGGNGKLWESVNFHGGARIGRIFARAARTGVSVSTRVTMPVATRRVATRWRSPGANRDGAVARPGDSPTRGRAGIFRRIVVSSTGRTILWCTIAMITVMGVTLLPLCGAVFQCGCHITSGERHCNVHHAGGPHCPWCSAGVWVVGANFAGIFAGTAAAACAGLRWRWRVWAGVGAGTIGFLLAVAVVTLVTAVAVGYPVWFGVRL